MQDYPDATLPDGTQTDTHPAIDAVIAWVDGADPVHAAKRAHYMGATADQHADAVEKTRFDSQGEVYVCVASILKNLPWIRTIWIVTDGQRPAALDRLFADGLCSPDRVQIVDHSAILGDIPDVLPTFSSRTIEAATWRIPGLTDRYIYFNDDMFVNRPLEPDFFFNAAGPVVRGDRKSLPGRGWGGRAKLALRGLISSAKSRTRPSFKVAQQTGAQLAGATQTYIHQGHWPHPLRVATLAQFYAAHPDQFTGQIQHRFRDRRQHWPVALANHLEKNEIAASPRVAYLKPGRGEDAAVSALLSQAPDFGCMQSLDLLARDKAATLCDGLVQKFEPYLRRDMLGL